MNHCAPTATVVVVFTPSYAPSGMSEDAKKPYLEVKASAPAPSIGTNLIDAAEASSTKEPVGYPATTKNASIFPLRSASDAAPPFKASAVIISDDRPLASRIRFASTYVPEPGSSSDTRLPLRSATEFMPLSAIATRWICSSKRAAIVRRSLAGSLPSIVPVPVKAQ